MEKGKSSFAQTAPKSAGFEDQPVLGHQIRKGKSLLDPMEQNIGASFEKLHQRGLLAILLE
jgi:hypothetical protein